MTWYAVLICAALIVGAYLLGYSDGKKTGWVNCFLGEKLDEQ